MKHERASETILKVWVIIRTTTKKKLMYSESILTKNKTFFSKTTGKPSLLQTTKNLLPVRQTQRRRAAK